MTTTVPADLRDIIAGRFKRLKEEAKCRDCGTTAAACQADPTPGPGGLCCWSGRHEHTMDTGALARLHEEIAAGTVRSVEEVYPPKMQGPRRPSMSWLLHQGEIWQPKQGPAVRIADMDACHRYNTMRFLERRAGLLADAEVWRMLLSPMQPSGDMACDAFEREIDEMQREPVEWLRTTPLHQALSRGLPAESDDPGALRELAARAAHWSTCACRDDLGAVCACPPPRGEVGTGPDAEGVSSL